MKVSRIFVAVEGKISVMPYVHTEAPFFLYDYTDGTISTHLRIPRCKGGSARILRTFLKVR